MTSEHPTQKPAKGKKKKRVNVMAGVTDARTKEQKAEQLENLAKLPPGTAETPDNAVRKRDSLQLDLKALQQKQQRVLGRYETVAAQAEQRKLENPKFKYPKPKCEQLRNGINIKMETVADYASRAAQLPQDELCKQINQLVERNGKTARSAIAAMDALSELTGSIERALAQGIFD